MLRGLTGMLLAVAVVTGCGQKQIYTTSEKRAEKVTTKDVDLAAMFDKKARTFVMNEDAQEHNAPYRPGYNVRGESAPINSVAAVTKNINKDWQEIVEIMEKGQPYDYVALSGLGQRLMMRSDELVTARNFENAARMAARTGKSSTTAPPEDETDRAIMRFGVLARQFTNAAGSRKLDELDEIYTVLPAATPFITSSATTE